MWDIFSTTMKPRYTRLFAQGQTLNNNLSIDTGPVAGSITESVTGDVGDSIAVGSTSSSENVGPN